jgi:mono/diheme cytochrome c family protein
VAPNRRHSIPSRTDCAACHGSARVQPLGFNALQLSPDRDPNAIHGEPLKPGMVTLTSLVDEQLLTGARQDLLSKPPRIRTEHGGTRAVLGYLAANCSMCHNGNGEIAALGPVIRYQDLVEDGDAVARGLAGQRTRWQVPGVSDGESVLVDPGAPDLSALLVRMRSRAPSSQMPPLGTVVRDQAAVDALTRWIAGQTVGRK